MNLLSQLKDRKAKSLSTTISYRDTETGQSFRDVDITEYVPNDLSETAETTLKALAVSGVIEITAKAEGIESTNTKREFRASDVANGLATGSGISVDIPTDEASLGKLKLELLQARLSASKAEEPVESKNEVEELVKA